MRRQVVLSVAALAVVASGVGLAFYGREVPAKPENDIVAIRLEPPFVAGDEIECDSLASIEFTYSIRNNTNSVVRGLKLDLSCGCQKREPPPSELAPGEEGQLSFRLSAPLAGRMQRQIALLDESGEVVVSFEAALRVRIDPPALLSETDVVGLTFIEGDEGPREYNINTIEAAGNAPWLEDLACSPPESLRIVKKLVLEQQQGDPALVHRSYRFKIARQSLELGRHTIPFKIVTRDGASPPPPGAFHVNIVDRVTVVPRTLRFTTGAEEPPSAARVVVLFHAGQGSAEIEHYDEALIDVQHVAEPTGRAVAFMVAPVSKWPTTAETRVSFRVGEGDTREVTVQLVSAVVE